MKTIIKGIKKVTRLVGTKYDYAREMPVLNYINFEVESDVIIQIVDFELITNHDTHFFKAKTESLFTRHTPQIAINTINGLEYVNIINEYIGHNGKVIVVNKTIEQEEQKFNYDEIMERYNMELDKCYNDTINQFKENKPMQIQINNWLNGGMTKEEIIIALNKYKYGEESFISEALKICYSLQEKKYE